MEPEKVKSILTTGLKVLVVAVPVALGWQDAKGSSEVGYKTMVTAVDKLQTAVEYQDKRAESQQQRIDRLTELLILSNRASVQLPPDFLGSGGSGGNGIGVGGIGTIGHGTGSGYGAGAGRLHRTKPAPVPAMPVAERGARPMQPITETVPPQAAGDVAAANAAIPEKLQELVKELPVKTQQEQRPVFKSMPLPRDLGQAADQKLWEK